MSCRGAAVSTPKTNKSWRVYTKPEWLIPATLIYLLLRFSGSAANKSSQVHMFAQLALSVILTVTLWGAVHLQSGCESCWKLQRLVHVCVCVCWPREGLFCVHITSSVRTFSWAAETAEPPSLAPTSWRRQWLLQIAKSQRIQEKIKSLHWINLVEVVSLSKVLPNSLMYLLILCTFPGLNYLMWVAMAMTH